MSIEIPLSEKIIVALDVSSKEAVRNIVTSLGDSIGFYKVGKELFVSEGPDIIKYLKDKDKKVFLDLKFHDIPNTVSRAAASLVRLGVNLFTIHALGGRTMMESTVLAVREESRKLEIHKSKILAVTVLTNMTNQDLQQIGLRSSVAGGINLDVKEQVKRLASLARESGVNGVVSSPLEIEMLREVMGSEKLIVTPGIRPASAVSDDQKRVMTPGEAVTKGADHLVIGRPIVQADDPKRAAEAILREIEECKK